MEFFNQFVIAPNASYLERLRFLLVLMLSISMPYLGILLAGTIVSMAFNTRDRDIPNATFARMAKDLMNMVSPSPVVAVVLGIAPLIVMYMIFGQWLFESNANAVFDLLPAGIIVTALGVLAANTYGRMLYREGKNSDICFSIGGAAVALLALGTYILIGCIVRFNDPERWHLMHDPIRQLVSFNIIWKHLFFVHAGAALMGAGMLYFFFDWSGPKPEMDEEYAKFTKLFGAGASMAMLTALPVLGFFYMVTTPHLAKSSAVFDIPVVLMAVFFVLFLMLYRTLRDTSVRVGRPVFVLFLIAVVLVSVMDQYTLVNATKEHTAKLITEAEEQAAAIAMEREQERSAAIKVDVARGEEVFKTVCSTCHRMDERLVGPPLNTVLPKYKGHPDDMVAFVQKPHKVNPDYPPMPAPGLSLGDTKSVVAYLLGETPGQGGGSGDSGH